MAVAASSALIEELDHAVSGRPPQRRTEILRQVMNLFLSGADRFNEAQVGVFDDVLVRLIDRVEAGSLAQLSRNLSGVGSAPKEAVRQLAFHEDASVAIPVLSRSRQLSDQDLVEIASTRGQRHLLAISGRATLGASLSDVLVERGDSTVHNTLAQNSGALLSEAGYTALVKDAERDDSLAETLGLRQDIPPDLFRELVAKAAVRVRTRLLEAAPPEWREELQAAVVNTARQVHAPPPKPVDYTGPRSGMVELNRTGKLNDSTVNRFAVQRDYTSVVAALSFLSSAPVESIEPLIGNDRLNGLIVACKAARLNWATTTMIIRNRPDCAPVSTQQFEQAQTVFDALTLSGAQRTIRTQNPDNKTDGS
ncbi:DUF2336 domain-containing protein [Bradyrhizobium sp. dw_78]|uniref:DUF2336 domain-containing protein n=1 Tax=Bradyrhizobium sp. dw_78 TaxID=2719793 RepID=UPI001BD3D524|nr:DUF2336 domain-containing protein [Bradyrhizobium sp. dw_78]